MALSDKKILMVVPERDFQDEEYDRVNKVLQSKGIKVTIDSSSIGEIRGMKGISAKSTVKIDDVKSYDYDTLVFVGGPGAQKFMEQEKAGKLAKDAEYKVLGAIGVAPAFLAKAEVLKGEKATGDRSLAGFMESKGCSYTGQPLQIDSKMVIAESSKYAEHFANALVEILQK